MNIVKWGASLLILSASSTLFAQIAEGPAKDVASDYAAAVSAATGVITDLQPAINNKKVKPQDVEDNSLNAAFKKKFQTATGKTFDSKTEGLMQEYRQNFATSFKEITTKYRPAMIKGGEDAFVPAFFRAQLLKKMNETMKGKIRAIATTKNSQLINADSKAETQFKNSPIKDEAVKLVNEGKPDPVNKTINHHFMAYRPMKLAESCVACHARNGLQEKVGEFGGAIIVDVPLK